MNKGSIFGLLLVLSYGLATSFGISKVKLTLEVEGKTPSAPEMLSECNMLQDMPAVKGVLSLRLSPESTALQFTYSGLRSWFGLEVSDEAPPVVEYGGQWMRRSL